MNEKKKNYKEYKIKKENLKGKKGRDLEKRRSRKKKQWYEGKRKKF